MESTLSQHESLRSDSDSFDLSDLSDDSSSSIIIESPSREKTFNALSINNEEDSLDIGGLSEQFENMNISKVDSMNISAMKREVLRGDQSLLHEDEVQQEMNMSENSFFGQERSQHESFEIFTHLGNDDAAVQVLSPNVSAIERAVSRDEEEEKMNATFINVDSSSLFQTVEGDSLLVKAISAHSSVSVLKCVIL